MDHLSIGETLRRAREALPASIYQAARETRIRVDFLQAMERDSFRFVSGGTYVKGMLKAYASWLGLDEDKIAAEFERIHASQTKSSLEQILRPSVPPPSRPRERLWVIAAGVAAATLLVLSLVGVLNPASTPTAPPEAAPTSPAEEPGENGEDEPDTVAQAPVPEYVEVTITITGDRCWIQVFEDGREERPLFSGTLMSGNSRTWRANQSLKVTLGARWAVSITVNGVDLGTPPGEGDVATFIFYPDTRTFERPS